MENKEFNFKDFEKTYSFDTLGKIDVNVHRTMLNHFFKKFPSENGMVIFDVGCNGGSFVNTINGYLKNHSLHCFEPHPRLYELLTSKHKGVKINNYCLSNENGEAIIYIPSQSVGVSSIVNKPLFDIFKTKPGADGTTQKVIELKTETKTIDTYCDENGIEKIDFIKIDVEGAEKMVFEGAEKMLSTNKIIGGQFEHGSTLSYANTSLEEIKNYLEGFGYDVYTDLSKSDALFMLK